MRRSRRSRSLVVLRLPAAAAGAAAARQTERGNERSELQWTIRPSSGSGAAAVRVSPVGHMRGRRVPRMVNGRTEECGIPYLRAPPPLLSFPGNGERRSGRAYFGFRFGGGKNEGCRRAGGDNGGSCARPRVDEKSLRDKVWRRIPSFLPPCLLRYRRQLSFPRFFLLRLTACRPTARLTSLTCCPRLAADGCALRRPKMEGDSKLRIGNRSASNPFSPLTGSTNFITTDRDRQCCCPIFSREMNLPRREPQIIANPGGKAVTGVTPLSHHGKGRWRSLKLE